MIATDFSNGMLIGLLVGLVVTGCVAGTLAGLLGVGGGIVIVPVLFLVLDLLDFPEATAMHTAVATSLATIIPTAISSTSAHYRRAAVDLALLRRWAILMALGAAAGGLLSKFLQGEDLALIFGVVALLVALNMASPRKLVLGSDLPASRTGQGGLAAGIGLFSSLMGSGGGTLGVPILSAFSYPIHRAVGTAAAFGLIIAVPAVIGFVWSGIGVPDRPPLSSGYVNLAAAAVIFPCTVLTAPVGARLAHALDPALLRRAFALFLALSALRMLSSVFSG